MPSPVLPKLCQIGWLVPFLVACSAHPGPTQPSPASPAQHPAQHPGKPSPAREHCQSRAKSFLTGKGFLPDSDASFSAAGMLRFGSVFGLFGAAVPLRFPVVRGWLWGLVFGAQPSPAKALPDRAVCSVFGAARLGPPTQPSAASVPLRFPVVSGWLWDLVFGAQPSPAKALADRTVGSVFGGLFSPARPNPAQPSQCQRVCLYGIQIGQFVPLLARLVFVWGRHARPIPAQPSPAQPAQPAPRPAQPSTQATPQHSPRALPKPCQRFSYRKKFLTGFRRIVLGRRNALFWVRFWPVWGRRAAAFPCCEGVALGPGFWCAAQPSPPAQHPGQLSTHTTPAQPAGIAKAVPKAFLPDSDASFSAAGMLRFGSVFGLFGAAVPLRFPVVRGWLWGLVFGAQPSPARQPSTQASSAPTQPQPSPRALPRPSQRLSYRIQTHRSRPQECFVLGPFLACLGPPCRCVFLL